MKVLPTLALLATCFAPAKAATCDPSVQEVKTIPYTIIGETLNFDIGYLPDAISDVTITAEFLGDLNAVVSADVQLGASTNICSLADSEDSPPLLGLGVGLKAKCDKDSKTVTISAEVFNQDHSTISMAIDAKLGVTSFLCADNMGTITISYLKDCSACIPSVREVKTIPYTIIGDTLNFDIGYLPDAISDVTITAEFLGDLNAVVSADVKLGASTNICSLADSEDSSPLLGLDLSLEAKCDKDSKTVTISAEVFNQDHSTISMAIDAKLGVTSFLCADNMGTITISYLKDCSACVPSVQEVKTIPYTIIGDTLNFDIGHLPDAISDVTITAEFLGDLNAVVSAKVQLGASTNLCTLADSAALVDLDLSLEAKCGKDSKTVTISADVFNQDHSTISMAIDANLGVTSVLCADNMGTISISYLKQCHSCVPSVQEVKTIPYNIIGQTLNFDFGYLPDAVSDVTITAEFLGDLNAVVSANVKLGASTNICTLADISALVDLDLSLGAKCDKDSKTVTISADVFNQDHSIISIAIDAKLGITSFLCAYNMGTISISYLRALDEDCALPEPPVAAPVVPLVVAPTRSQTGGDPHFTTWKNEHFEYHGQCDLVLVHDANFADGLGLDIQIRTKIVRYWSYIKTVAINIGNDILEIEGSANVEDAEAHYWFNLEYQGELDTFAGFPVTQKLPSVYKRHYSIDLSSKYPGASIDILLYKEFVRVQFKGDESVYGNTVGLLGDAKTGKTLARDGATEMNNFVDFGDEWQVLPSEPMLFHKTAHPQFPELCVKPEDPRGQRKRRLGESNISIEQAEAACATLKDPLTIKDCVYDILATQDMDMVGAF
ncbi:unnamed protein product [Cylindrotheca closterium]|uniref:VWFD domain-containing protein n=1 Tax=Cylindrotheca closterium TaxID=2856 RepID=A0AAD2FPK4_9STRA|nr:unnamed protein product [Cylindrotheca closterium]